LCFPSPDLQFESALTNIASVMSDQTIAVVSAVAVAGYISVLDSPHPVVAEQDVWALSNIACDGPELRDHLMKKALLSLCSISSHLMLWLIYSISLLNDVKIL
jgi:importin subunit alpha-2